MITQDISQQWYTEMQFHSCPDSSTDVHVDMLSMEHVDRILRHNVEYRGLLLWLPILQLGCWKHDQLEREARWRGRKFGFFGGKCWWNGLKLSWNNSSLLAHHFHQVSLSGSSGTMRYHAKTYCLGQRLLGSVRGWKKHDRVWGGDYLTSKENALLTVSKCQPHPINTSDDSCLVCKALDGLLSLLQRQSEWLGSRLPSLTTPEDDQNSQDPNYRPQQT